MNIVRVVKNIFYLIEIISMSSSELLSSVSSNLKSYYTDIVQPHNVYHGDKRIFFVSSYYFNYSKVGTIVVQAAPCGIQLQSSLMTQFWTAV